MNKILGDILFKLVTWPYIRWAGNQYYKFSKGNLDLALLTVNLKIDDKDKKQTYRILVICDKETFHYVTYSLGGVLLSLAVIGSFIDQGYYNNFKTMDLKYYKIEDKYDAKTGERIFGTM